MRYIKYTKNRPQIYNFFLIYANFICKRVIFYTFLHKKRHPEGA